MYLLEMNKFLVNETNLFHSLRSKLAENVQDDILFGQVFGFLTIAKLVLLVRAILGVGFILGHKVRQVKALETLLVVDKGGERGDVVLALRSLLFLAAAGWIVI
jgi:hypothetical protein